MKKLIFLTPFVLLMLSFQSFAQGYVHENLKIKRSAEYADAPVASNEQFDLSFSFKNLRLFPIIANEAFVTQHKDIGKFTLLKDAIESDKIIITETGARNLADEGTSAPNIIDTTSTQIDPIDLINPEPTSNQQVLQIQQLNNYNNNSDGGVDGTVNTLFARNKSNDTIFIMAGEVVKGGKQDRVIAQDVVLVPGEEIDLGAFCVESSRWTTKDNNKGEFTGYYNVSSMDIRQTVTQDKNQSEVWNKVDEHTTKNGATSETNAYTNLENSEEYQKSVKLYLEKFQNSFANDPRVIGVIAVTGDKVMGCDMFATHQLFIDSYSNLIHSYVGFAITKGSAVTIGNNEVYAYLDEILKTEEKQNEEIEKNGTVYEWKKKKLHIAKF